MTKDIEVWQGGVSPDWSGRTTFRQVGAHAFEMKASHPLPSGKAQPGLAFAIKHPSKGGGETRVWTWLPPSMFLSVAKMMAKASPAAAEQAFLAVLTEGAKSRAKGP